MERWREAVGLKPNVSVEMNLHNALKHQFETVIVPVGIPSKESASDSEDSVVLQSFGRRSESSESNGASFLYVGTREFEVASRAFDKRSLGYIIVKRLFDIVFSLIVIAVAVALLPVALVVLLATVISTKGSPFYTQLRIGRFGKPFRILKLRTMVADSDDVEKYLSVEQLEQWKKERKIDDDPRITKLGAVFRKTSLDELPQFLNVLAGQMSVIGPRAISKDELTWYSINEQMELLAVPQGVTGWWQVSARNNATFENGDRQALELEYCRNANFAMDLKVFLATFGAMFGRGRTGR